jgi:hypothetical protein
MTEVTNQDFVVLCIGKKKREMIFFKDWNVVLWRFRSRRRNQTSPQGL